MTDENPSQRPISERLGSAFIQFLKALVRLLAIVVMGVLIGGAIFFAAPWLYRQYILPAQNTILRLEDAQTRQEQTNQQFNQRLDSLNSRLQDLESAYDQNKQVVDELRQQFDDAGATQAAMQAGVQNAQATLSAAQTAIDASLAGQGDLYATLSTSVARSDSNLSALATQMGSDNAPLQALQRQVQVIEAMQLLTRGRLFLAENNAGLATQDVQAAYRLIKELSATAPSYQEEALTNLVSRLEFALANLPDKPLLADGDLEVAWQILRDGLPQAPVTTAEAVPTATPAPGVSASATSTPTPTPSFTPTP
jgi:TolA-binding protein